MKFVPFADIVIHFNGIHGEQWRALIALFFIHVTILIKNSQNYTILSWLCAGTNIVIYTSFPAFKEVVVIVAVVEKKLLLHLLFLKAL